MHINGQLLGLVLVQVLILILADRKRITLKYSEWLSIQPTQDAIIIHLVGPTSAKCNPYSRTVKGGPGAVGAVRIASEPDVG